MADHCFSGENTCMSVKGWEWGSSANMKYFPFPALNCCPHTEAVFSAHSIHLTELAALQQPCSHPLHTWGKWLITPPGTPCKKSMEFPWFEKDTCTYSNSWLIKKVSVDGCQNTWPSYWVLWDQLTKGVIVLHDKWLPLDILYLSSWHILSLITFVSREVWSTFFSLQAWLFCFMSNKSLLYFWELHASSPRISCAVKLHPALPCIVFIKQNMSTHSSFGEDLAQVKKWLKPLPKVSPWGHYRVLWLVLKRSISDTI